MTTDKHQALIEFATQAGLDAACAEIQTALNITAGDRAGAYFSGSAADPLRELLRGYLVHELQGLEQDAAAALAEQQAQHGPRCPACGEPDPEREGATYYCTGCSNAWPAPDGR